MRRRARESGTSPSELAIVAESAVDPAPSAAAKAAAAKGQTMNITGELQTAQPMTHLGTIRTHPRGRTGVRFVLTNATDPGRPDDYSAWYDNYENAIIRPGLIANAFRFENPNAAGTPTDPRYAAIYDIVSPIPHRPGRRPR